MAELSLGTKSPTDRRWLILPALAVVVAAVALAAVTTGPFATTPVAAWAALTGTGDATTSAVLWTIRLPRIALALLVGATLALGGALMQGLFRNPLADPGLVGVSGGAALGAVVTIVGAGVWAAPLHAVLGPLAVPAMAFAGGLTATWIVWRCGQRDGQASLAMLLLAGIAVGAIAAAGIGLCLFLADDRQARDINFWMLGSVGGATWHTVAVTVPFALAALLLGLWQARPLNALLLGERETGQLGFDVDRVKRIAALATALGVGAGVAACGTIGFIGLAAPHLVRLAIGSDHRLVLPASALLGAALLLLADILARTLAAPADLPIGLLTSALGAPFFLWLLRRGA